MKRNNMVSETDTGFIPSKGIVMFLVMSIVYMLKLKLIQFLILADNRRKVDGT
jgi:hypothetical protein